MKPPYEITSSILNHISLISEKIGEVKSAKLTQPSTELRKRNKIRTIQSSLAIEGNTMTVDQITDVINNKRVLAPQKDLLEVKNAIHVYSKLDKFETFSLQSLCKAHKLLMQGLVNKPGEFRTTSVGIVKGSKLAHVAPPVERIYQLMKDLFQYLKNEDELFLIKSCVFHYEFEFIHPFLDGNGRMGRLWQTLILSEYSSVFSFLPIETLVKERQKEYYKVLGECDNVGKSTAFIDFMLGLINLSLEELLKTQSVSLDGVARVQVYKQIIGTQYFSRQDYMRSNKDISSATASRDLKRGVDEGMLEKIGDKRLSKYRYKKLNLTSVNKTP